jgi:hypothetical protein
MIRQELRNRLNELEKQYTAAVQLIRDETAPAYWAYVHAIQVVGVVLYGEPKIDESLRIAQFRAKQQLNARFAAVAQGRINPILFPRLKLDALFPGADYNLKFERIFSDAPTWLLKFTAVEWDAKILGFKLRELVGAPELGNEARRDRNWWPFLPEGTIDAGGPCSEPDVPYEKIVKRWCRRQALKPK